MSSSYLEMFEGLSRILRLSIPEIINNSEWMIGKIITSFRSFIIPFKG